MASRSVFVLATVVSIQDKFCYPCCSRCHRRVRTRDDGQTYWCDLCKEEYSREQAQYRYRISVEASDRTQLAHITVFGSCLDKIFGATATNFTRFVNSLTHADLPMPSNRLVSQAIEQCFVGSKVRFGFRVCAPFGRTASQIARNSPFHLKNIDNKQPNSTQDCDDLPSLLACQVARCSSTEESLTVLEVIEQYIQVLNGRAAQSLSLYTSSQDFAQVERVQSEVINDCSFSVTSYLSLPRKRSLSIYCTPQELGSQVSPLVLTGVSQPSSLIVLAQQNNLGDSLKQDNPLAQSGHACLRRAADESRLSCAMEDEQYSTHSLLKMQPDISQTPKLESFNLAPADESMELQLSQKESTDYMDFPSSEDLSAFLADLVLEDNVSNNQVGQSPLTLDSKKGCNIPLVSATSFPEPFLLMSREEKEREPGDEVVVSEAMTSKGAVRHVSEASIRDYTELTDFPSSEDLDAFLADMELDYEDMPIRTTSTSGISLACDVTNGHEKSATSFPGPFLFLPTAREEKKREHGNEVGESEIQRVERLRGQSFKDSVDGARILHDSAPNKSHCKLRGERVCQGNILVGFSDREHEGAICDNAPSGAVSSAQESRRRSDTGFPLDKCKIAFNSLCTDSQLLRDYESLLGFSDASDNEKDREQCVIHVVSGKDALVSSDKQQKCSPFLWREGKQRRESSETAMSNGSGMHLFLSGTNEEFSEENIVCNTPQSYKKERITRPRDRITTDREGWIRSARINSQQEPSDENVNSEISTSRREIFDDSCGMKACVLSSPELFSQTSTPIEQALSKTPDLFSSPRTLRDEANPCATRYSKTPDLFSCSRGSSSDHTHSRSRHELNSVSLFSNSGSFASSSNYSHPLQNKSGTEFEDDSETHYLRVTCHSTPLNNVLHRRDTSIRLGKLWTPARVSPLVVNSGSSRWDGDTSPQGTPLLFSQISNSASSRLLENVSYF